MQELSRVKGQPQVLGKWAHAFLETCLGFHFQRDYRLGYSTIGMNWRPTLVISREGVPFCTMEVGHPHLKRHKNIPYGLLFTGTEWRLYDLQTDVVPALMAVCDVSGFLTGQFTPESVVELEKELAPFHETAYLSKVWETLAEEARKCTTESVAKALLSKDILQTLQTQLGVSDVEGGGQKLLRYKLVDMLEGETHISHQITKLPKVA